MRLRVAIAAQRDVFRISNRYDRLVDGLGDEFLDEIGRIYSFLKLHPFARRATLGDTRRWPVRRFPYIVLYAVEAETVYVLAVGHARRGPRYWRRRQSVSRE